jgi:hypothetical protein
MSGPSICAIGQLAALHCELIVSLAAQHKLPAVYSDEYFVTRDGLASYGPDRVAIYPLAAGYVYRILMGEKPANLQCRRRLSTNWRSISRPRKRSVSVVEGSARRKRAEKGRTVG